ncbi:MAG: sulfatase-like hydrolase/transferase, partial [Clostridiales bacterium]
MKITETLIKIRGVFSRIMTSINDKLGKILKKPLLFCALWSVLLAFILEALGRRSLFDAMAYFVGSPLMFFYNALIIMLTLCIALLFKRRFFVMFLVTIFWVGSGIANCVLLSFRTTPFSAIDLTLVPYALSIIDIYFSKTQITLLTVLLIAVIIAIIIIGLKAPKFNGKIQYMRYLCALAVIASLVFTVSYVGAQTKVIGARFGNLADAYENFGFAYCLSNSFVDTGIGKPPTYSEKDVTDIVKPLKDTAKPDDEKEKPNIIFMQLESFFDVNKLNNVEFSSDPVPVFTKLQKDFPSGYLNVPSVGAGTANTEFEILTGMNLDFFGAGEYPYKTILLKETCESMPNNLKELGYYTYAMHNNRASFYGRDEVFSQMGFDCFDSKEYMQDIEYTQAGWAKDEVLVDEITNALKATEQQDFIYTITVQGHGKYTDKGLDYTEPIKLTMAEGEDADAYACFVKQLHEVDTFVGDLLAKLKTIDEDTVVVMYGDHLPSLELSAADLKNGNLYQTEYVIWNNMGLKAEDRDISTYQ